MQESAEDALASLVKKAAGPAPELVVDANDQLTIAPAAGEGETGYAYPPLSLFRKQQPTDEKGVEEELTHNADLLVKTLSSFGVQTRMMDISRGPSVTRYELQPLAGVKISRITGLADDIALNLATAGVRIEAPIPGKAAVGSEVPNRNSTSVSIRSILESPVFTKSASPLTLALGKDIAGACQVADLTKMPHLLIAGSTGSGKSVCINAIVMSFLYKSSPEDLKLIMIDPKVVELAEYNGIPHLLMPVVTEPRKAAGALGAAVGEMEKRYHLFAETNVRDIKSYNRMAAETEGMEKLPYIAIVIDELADLMMVAGKEACGGHAPYRGHAAPLGGRHHGPYQGQYPQPHRFRRQQPDRQPHHSGRGRRGKAAGHGRHAVHACRRKQARPHPGDLCARRRDQRRVELHQKALFR